MQNWIVWNRTVWHLTVCGQKLYLYGSIVWINWVAGNRCVFDKLCTHAKLNCLK